MSEANDPTCFGLTKEKLLTIKKHLKTGGVFAALVAAGIPPCIKAIDELIEIHFPEDDNEETTEAKANFTLP